MQLPFFYTPDVQPSQKEITLDEDASRHIVSVLRMKEEDQVRLTDGSGHLFLASIIAPHKKHCTLRLLGTEFQPATDTKTIIAISLIKNSSRFEWFLEKATEIGVNEIVPLICERTEKIKFRGDRMHNILVSAVQQSQQCWLPILHQPIGFELLFAQQEIVEAPGKFIAHCMNSEKNDLGKTVRQPGGANVLLIGPEGDFTSHEINFALSNKFIPVSLGKNRLRTETAGIVGATLLVTG